VTVTAGGHRRDFDREGFFGWLWEEFGERGLVGVHEGSMLSERAAELGLETDSFTVDAAEAPRERDWVGVDSQPVAEIYFSSREGALVAGSRLRTETCLDVPEPEEQQAEDWDAIWKASFTGISIPPHWEVVPPWREPPEKFEGKLLRLNPGAGFGTGTHETTQLCLELLAESSARKTLPERILDFGSGSGILAIGTAALQPRSETSVIHAVEIDELAIDNAIDNARLNQLEDRIRYTRYLNEGDRGYGLILANILKPVLLEFADDLMSRLAPHGQLILSGLVEADVEAVAARYSSRLGRLPAIKKRGDWRALYWG